MKNFSSGPDSYSRLLLWLALAVVLLVINQVPAGFAHSCTPPPDGMVANWRAEGNANDSFGANNGSLVNGVTFVSGMVGQAFNFDGVSNYVTIPNSVPLILKSEITVEFWYKDTGSSASGHGLVTKENPTGSQAVNFGIALDLGPANVLEPYISDVTVGPQFSPSSPTPAAGVFHHLAATFLQIPGTATVQIGTYVDGVLVRSAVVSGTLSRTVSAAPVLIGATLPGLQYFKGIIDEIAIYNRVLTPVEIGAIYMAGSAGKCTGLTPPFVYVPPAPAIVQIGQTNTFSVAVGGTQPIHYRWTLNGTNLPGATNHSLAVNNVQLKNAGSYTVIITNAAGSVTTAPVTLAATTLDLSNYVFNWWQPLSQSNNRYSLAQTFVPTVSGQLGSFWVSGDGNGSSPTLVTITDVDGGQPGTNVLGTGWIQTLTDDNMAVFTNSTIYLNAGKQYAAILSTEAPPTFSSSYDFRLSLNDSYPAGVLWSQLHPSGAWQQVIYGGIAQVDLDFATFMVAGIPPLRISSPASGSQILSSQALPISVAFSNGVPDQLPVTLYNGTNVIGTVSQPPYTFFWTNPPVGLATLSAAAIVNGMTSTSAVIDVTVLLMQPPNDNFASRYSLVGDYCQTTVTNSYGTVESGEPRPVPSSTGQSVWWTWTSPRTAWVTLAVPDATQTNAVLGVFSGLSVNMLVTITNGLGLCTFPAVSNQTYQIMVDSLSGSLSGSPLVVAVSDLELTSPASQSVYTVPASFNFQTQRTSFDRVITNVQFFQAATLVGSVTNSPYSLLVPSTTPGNYNLGILAWDTLGVYTISQSVPVTVLPQNDNFSNAIPIYGYTTNIQTSDVNGTIEPGEPHWADNQGGHSIWYNWTAPATGVCTVSGTGPGTGLLIGIYAGSKVSQLSTVAVNAFGSGTNPVVFEALAGTNYNISIDGWLGEQGTVAWSLALQPANDNFANGAEIVGSQYQTVTSVEGSSLETNENIYVQNTNAGSVWWSWTAPATAQTTVTMFSTTPVELMIFTGSSLANLVSVTNTGTTWTSNATLTFRAQEGTNYQIAAIGDPSQVSSATLQLTSQTVHFVSPADLSTFEAPANMLLEAVPDSTNDTSSPIGLPTIIEYFTNGYFAGASSTPPYGLSLSGIAAGSYTLEAKEFLPTGMVNESAPISILVYTNQDVPVPRIFAGTYATQSWVVNPVGAVYILGFPASGSGGQGANGTVVDGTHPRLANWPVNAATRWKTINNGWALSTDGHLYQNGVTNIPTPPGVHEWLNVGNGGWAFGDDGQIYSSGVNLLTFPLTGAFWVDGGSGYYGSYTLAQNGVFYFNSQAYPFPPGVSRWIAAGNGLGFAILLGDDGNLYQDHTLVPMPVGVTNWTAFAAGGYHAMAIGGDGQLYTWGRNWEGQLGLGFTGNDLPATQKVTLPAGVTAWTSIAAGSMHSLAIGNDGFLYSWGANDNGQLGVGSLIGQLVPTRVNGLGALWTIPIISTSGASAVQPDGSFRFRFNTDLNRTYRIQYSDDGVHWKTASQNILGTGGFVEWTDNGPPNTDAAPGTIASRVYRIAFTH